MIWYNPKDYLVNVYNHEYYNKLLNLNCHSRKYCTLFEIQCVKVYEYKKT